MLPQGLINRITEIGNAQRVDVAETIRSVTALIGDDECVSYRVWGGAGFGQENVLVDVYVLGRRAFYCYTVLTTHVQGSCHFLDSIPELAMAQVADERSPYLLLVFSQREEPTTIFGSSEDLKGLEQFRANIIAQRMRNRESRNAS